MISTNTASIPLSAKGVLKRSVASTDLSFLMPPPKKPCLVKMAPATQSSYVPRQSAPAVSPRRILDLPENALKRILAYALNSPDASTQSIQPFYQKGMLSGYIRVGYTPNTSTLGDMVDNDNVDLRAMLVCKKFAELGSEVFYSAHWFGFRDPHVFKWWLNHIGVKNLSHIRRILIDVYPGFSVPSSDRCSLDLTSEERWLQGFRWLRPRHKLDSLYVTVKDDWKYGDDASGEEADKYQNLLLRELLRYRGLQFAAIQDFTCRWGRSRGQWHQYALTVTQKEDTAQKESIVRRKAPTLSELMEDIKLDRMLQESLEWEAVQAQPSRRAALVDVPGGFEADNFYDIVGYPEHVSIQATPIYAPCLDEVTGNDQDALGRNRGQKKSKRCYGKRSGRNNSQTSIFEQPFY